MGVQFTPYTLQQNAFLGSVLNKIGRQEWASKSYTNPLAQFKKGFIENASDIEEIYVARVQSTAQNLEGTTTLDRISPNITTRYHRQNYAKLFSTTISDKQVRRAFTTPGGVKKLSDEILESLHTGYQYEEYIAMRDNLGDLLTNLPATAKKEISAVTDQASAKAFTKEVKKVVGKMQFRSSNYSIVETTVPLKDMMLVVTPELLAEIDVELLAFAFNLSPLQMTDRIVVVDQLPTKTVAMLLDKNALMVFDVLYHIEDQRNGQGMFTNWHLNSEKIISTSNMYGVCQFHTA